MCRLAGFAVSLPNGGLSLRERRAARERLRDERLENQVLRARGDAPAIASAVNINCRNCIPLLAEHFSRLNCAGARAAVRGALGHTTPGRG